MPGTPLERPELLQALGKIETLKWALASLTNISVEMEKTILVYLSTKDANIPDSILLTIIGSVERMERVSPILNGLITQSRLDTCVSSLGKTTCETERKPSGL